MCIKSEFKEIILKLAANGQSDLGFLLTSKLCHQRAVCSWPGLYTCMKTLKNMYKIRLQSDFFKFATKVKMIRSFCGQERFFPKELSALAPGLYTYIKSLKMCIKLDFFF